MRTSTKTIYTFDELSEDAKEKARDWFRAGYPDYEWWESTYEDAERIGLKLTSFDLGHNRHAMGCIETSAPECAESIKAKHGPDCETYKTAVAYLTELAKLGDAAPERDDLIEKWEDERERIDDEFERSILEDYSIILQKEYEYLLSDECIDETIQSNEYEFYEDGSRA